MANPMSERDIYDAQTERLLPCNCVGERHDNDCFIRRQAVASALREAAKRGDSWKTAYDGMEKECNNLRCEVERLQAELNKAENALLLCQGELELSFKAQDDLRRELAHEQQTRVDHVAGCRLVIADLSREVERLKKLASLESKAKEAAWERVNELEKSHGD